MVWFNPPEPGEAENRSRVRVELSLLTRSSYSSMDSSAPSLPWVWHTTVSSSAVLMACMDISRSLVTPVFGAGVHLGLSIPLADCSWLGFKLSVCIPGRDQGIAQHRRAVKPSPVSAKQPVAVPRGAGFFWLRSAVSILKSLRPGGVQGAEGMVVLELRWWYLDACKQAEIPEDHISRGAMLSL